MINDQTGFLQMSTCVTAVVSEEKVNLKGAVSTRDIRGFGGHWYRRVTGRLLNRSLWCCKKCFCWHVRKMKL